MSTTSLASGEIVSRIRLRREADESGDSPNAADSGATATVVNAGRYAIAGEIARGGIGIVLRGEDPALGREIALKVLRDEHAARPAMLRRLVEEAQICGQLQHPGIPPVYELGVDAGRRPYFTMKLIRGRTLAALLRERPAPGDDRRRLLPVFEQVCQAVAYAHARGVIHRDLKPSNVMLGSFGEVQVVDWGLAKVLASAVGAEASCVDEEESGPDGGADAPARTSASTPDAKSEAGSVLGTPAYMPPEQARGEVEDLDERSDVFALGAILCEILTGLPPYQGEPAEMLRQAREGCLDEAFARLDASGADRALLELAKRCLDPERALRPRDAGVLARGIADWSSALDERSRRAEREALAARARASAERRARRWTVFSAIAVVAAVLLAGWSYQRAEQRREAERVREEQRRQVEERRRQVEERRRQDALVNVLALLNGLNQKGHWLISHAEAAPDRDAAQWADALVLCRQAVEQTADFATDEAARQRRALLSRELDVAVRAARSRAEQFAAGHNPRAKTVRPANP
jgi:serine/threonine-protein kinase